MIEWLTTHSGELITISFSATFTAIMVWTYWPSKKTEMQEQAMIPFHEEQ